MTSTSAPPKQRATYPCAPDANLGCSPTSHAGTAPDNRDREAHEHDTQCPPTIGVIDALALLIITFVAYYERRRADEFARAEEAGVRAEELRVAVQLQRALLPVGVVVRDDTPVAARYAAGSSTLEVSGDWYDTIELPDGGIALTVGDVVGHGLAAATTMGKLRIAIGALAAHATGPGQLLSHLDGFAAGNRDIDLATAVALRHGTVQEPGTSCGRCRWTPPPPGPTNTPPGRERGICRPNHPAASGTNRPTTPSAGPEAG